MGGLGGVRAGGRALVRVVDRVGCFLFLSLSPLLLLLSSLSLALRAYYDYV